MSSVLDVFPGVDAVQASEVETVSFQLDIPFFGAFFTIFLVIGFQMVASAAPASGLAILVRSSEVPAPWALVDRYLVLQHVSEAGGTVEVEGPGKEVLS